MTGRLKRLWVLICFIGLLPLKLEAAAMGRTQVQPKEPNLVALETKRPEIKKFIELLLIRDLATALSLDMKAKGFQQTDIDRILSGTAFNSYAKRCVQSGEVQASINRLLDRVVSTENLRHAILDAKRQELRSREIELATFFQQILRDKNLERNDIPEESGWNGFEALWNQIKGHLFE